jgi:hypothetical protein
MPFYCSIITTIGNFMSPAAGNCQACREEMHQFAAKNTVRHHFCAAKLTKVNEKLYCCIHAQVYI